MSRFHLDASDMGGGARVLLQSDVALLTRHTHSAPPVCSCGRTYTSVLQHYYISLWDQAHGCWWGWMLPAAWELLLPAEYVESDAVVTLMLTVSHCFCNLTHSNHFIMFTSFHPRIWSLWLSYFCSWRHRIRVYESYSLAAVRDTASLPTQALS